MGLYDPNTGKWYTEAAFAPPEVALYDNTKNQWIMITDPPPSDPEGYSTPRWSTVIPDPGTIPDVQELTDPTVGAVGMAAQLLRKQFEEWQSTFKPIELQAMNQLSTKNPSVLPTAIGKARAAAERTSGAMEGILQRQNRAMGIATSPEEEKTTGRILNLNTAASIAGAENQARANVAIQDESI